MTLENLKQNIEHEKEILMELAILFRQLDITSGKERDMLYKSINSLKLILAMTNNSIPNILENISPVKKLGEKGKEEKAGNLISISYEKGGVAKYITVNSEDKRRFIEELSLSTDIIKKLRKEYRVKEEKTQEFKKPSFYAKISNRFFSKLSSNFIEKGSFAELNTNLKKSNMPFILNTYVSMIFFSTLLSLIFAVALFVFLVFFKLGLEYPFASPVELDIMRVLKNLFVIIVVPILTFLAFYFYPLTEKQSVGRKIEQEMPFVTIHMAAIAGSGIEPSQIFKIIALGKDYPYTSQEIKKVINQVNIYGYDLVNALRNSARNTSSNRLAELFNGLATTISSGGSLTEFLDKRAETLLFDYKLDKEKATKVAETFMDIYISIVIAAPMIMMLLLILISVSGMSIGLSIDALTIIILLIVALINIVFLIFLHIEQPKY